jgi:hypothetical protein
LTGGRARFALGPLFLRLFTRAKEQQKKQPRKGKTRKNRDFRVQMTVTKLTLLASRQRSQKSTYLFPFESLLLFCGQSDFRF